MGKPDTSTSPLVPVTCEGIFWNIHTVKPRKFTECFKESREKAANGPPLCLLV